MKSKQLDKGIRQLMDEGLAQLFIQQPGNRKIVGTVGQLQFEVIAYRLMNEYGANCRFVPKSYAKACWITSDNTDQLNSFMRAKSSSLAKDKDDNLVFLEEVFNNMSKNWEGELNSRFLKVEDNADLLKFI